MYRTLILWVFERRFSKFTFVLKFPPPHFSGDRTWYKCAVILRMIFLTIMYCLGWQNNDPCKNDMFVGNLKVQFWSVQTLGFGHPLRAKIQWILWNTPLWIFTRMCRCCHQSSKQYLHIVILVEKILAIQRKRVFQHLQTSFFKNHVGLRLYSNLAYLSWYTGTQTSANWPLIPSSSPRSLLKLRLS